MVHSLVTLCYNTLETKNTNGCRKTAREAQRLRQMRGCNEEGGDTLLTPNIGMVSREADFSIAGLLCNSLEDAQVPYTFLPYSLSLLRKTGRPSL